MKRLSRFVVLTIIWSLHLTALAQDGSEPIVASDLLRIQQLGDVTVSPDGRSVVYSVRSIVEDAESDGEYTYETQLWTVSGREAPRQLTVAREGASSPAWHPEGDRLAFVRSVDGKPQIFVLSMFGGEPMQVTSFEHGASSPAWSPDGTTLLFAVSLPESEMRTLYGDKPWTPERPGRRPQPGVDVEGSPDGGIQQIRAWLDENEERSSPRVINRLDFQGEQGLESAPSYRHFYVVDRDSIGAWTEPRPITPLWGSFNAADWHPDGTRILLSGVEAGALHPDRERRSDIYITYVDQPRPRRLFSLADQQVSNPLVSPDGQTVAFIARDLLDPGFALGQAGVFALDDPSNHRLLTTELDRSVSQVRWSPDNWHLYFVAPSDGAFPLFRVRVFDEPQAAAPADSVETDVDVAEPSPSPIEQITDDVSGVRSFDLTAATIYYVMTRVENPYELYATSSPFEREQRLTDHNASWLASKRISRPEYATVRRDTLTIDYWVMRPTFFEEGRRYPLLVQMHGGPSAMWGPGEASMWHEFQFFASQGYAVVFSNPRGSGGYGYDFQRANFQDWGVGPAGDVLAVADAAGELPFVDADRQVLTGGSYAGYLTAWIVAHDDRFKAAVAQRGVYDLATFLGEGNAWRLVPSHFGGYPWEVDASIPPPSDDPWRPSPALTERFASPSDDGFEGELPSPEDEQQGRNGDGAGDANEAQDDGEDADDGEGDVPAFRDILIRNSPLTYVTQIETPLLIIHGDQDLRTGVIQSEMLYRSLKLLDRPVEYVRYPASGHELSRSGDPRLRIDRILRIYEFMERWI